jgi:hypothetical protein
LAGGEAVAADAGQALAGNEDEEVYQQISAVEHRMQLR